VGIGRYLADNCMCTVWVTRSRSVGWYSALRGVDVVVFFNSFGMWLEGVVRTGVLRMRMGSFLRGWWGEGVTVVYPRYGWA
jgi:hypothetical protein